jgi:hypothetical protein
MRGLAISVRNIHITGQWERIHIASFTTWVAAIYSASVVDRVIMDCFFELQDTAPPSMVNT